MAAKFSKKVSNFGSRFSQRADAAAGEPVGMDLITIATLALSIWSQVKQAFALCKVQPPAPIPVPVALAEQGVTEETWVEANGLKFAAHQSKGKNTEFSKAAIKRVSDVIAESKKIKRKAAKPTAIAALQSGRDEPVDAIAIAMQQIKDNEADLAV